MCGFMLFSYIHKLLFYASKLYTLPPEIPVLSHATQHISNVQLTVVRSLCLHCSCTELEGRYTEMHTDKHEHSGISKRVDRITRGVHTKAM
jgi:hypothetical protein